MLSVRPGFHCANARFARLFLCVAAPSARTVSYGSEISKCFSFKLALAAKQTTEGLGMLDKREAFCEYTIELATKLADWTIADRSQV